MTMSLQFTFAAAVLVALAPYALCHQTPPLQTHTLHHDAPVSGTASGLDAVAKSPLVRREAVTKSEEEKKTIPHVVFFTGPYDPEEVVTNNRNFVPHGTEFRYYNDAQMHASVRNISQHLEEAAGIKGAYKAFQNLRAEAFRVDLWRAMIIWEFGGLYIDAKDVLVSKLEDWIPPSEDSLVLCYDKYGDFYDNQIVAAPPKDAQVEVILRYIINNLHQKAYGNSTSLQRITGSKLDPTWTACLGITGPVAYTAALREAGLEPHLRCLSDHVGGKQNGFEFDRAHYKNSSDHQMVIVDSAHVHNSMGAGLGGTTAAKTGYYQLWATHGVYCDDPYPADAGACAAEKLGGNMVEMSEELASHMAPYWSKIV